MTNIVKFPKPGGQRLSVAFTAEKIRAAMPAAKSVAGFVWGTLRFQFLLIRIPEFLVIYWLRAPIFGLCSFVSFITLFAWLFAWYAWPHRTEMVWSFGICSFVTFAIAWLYDFVLMAISPQDMISTL